MNIPYISHDMIDNGHLHVEASKQHWPQYNATHYVEGRGKPDWTLIERVKGISAPGDIISVIEGADYWSCGWLFYEHQKLQNHSYMPCGRKHIVLNLQTHKYIFTNGLYGWSNPYDTYQEACNALDAYCQLFNTTIND